MMRLRKQTGVAAVEFALILVPMLVLCMGITELGRALYYYNGLVKATRGAARYLTAKDLSSLTSGTAYGSGAANSDVQAAIALAWCGTTVCASGATSLVPGLDASKVSIITHNDVQATDGTSALGSVHLVTVRIGPDDPANGNDPRAVWFESFLPYSITRFKFSPVTITMAWSVT